MAQAPAPADRAAQDFAVCAAAAACYTRRQVCLVGNVVLLIVCLDLEGVLTPEIWIEVAERTGIDALRATTRDVPDYDALMRQRLDLLTKNGLRLPDIEAVIAAMEPLDGALGFVDWLRARYQLVILSDTYYEFAEPLMRRLGRPILLCNRLEVDGDGRIVGYRLRFADHKRESVASFQKLGFRVIAAGDSYNDLGMLEIADCGVLFRAPDGVVRQFPQYPAAAEYDELKVLFDEARARLD